MLSLKWWQDYKCLWAAKNMTFKFKWVTEKSIRWFWTPFEEKGYVETDKTRTKDRGRERLSGRGLHEAERPQHFLLITGPEEGSGWVTHPRSQESSSRSRGRQDPAQQREELRRKFIFPNLFSRPRQSDWIPEWDVNLTFWEILLRMLWN